MINPLNFSVSVDSSQYVYKLLGYNANNAEFSLYVN